MNKVLNVTLVDGTTDQIEVQKIALGRYADLLRALKTLPESIMMFISGSDNEELQNMNFQEFLPKLIPIVAESLNELCAVLAIPTNKDAEYFMNNVELPDAIDVLVAALELNDYNRVLASIKKLMAPKTTAPTMESQSATEQPTTT